MLADIDNLSLDAELFPDMESVRQRVARAYYRVQHQAQAGERILQAAVNLWEVDAATLIPTTDSLAREIEPLSDLVDTGAPVSEEDACVPALHGQAASLVRDGQIDGAITLYCALLDWETGRNDALLGLSVCAVRLGRYDAALAFARDYLDRGGQHPRACVIAGLCQRKLGDRKAAQNFLAAAARGARRDPALRADLRIAQRLLIALNFER